jgi:hypothetical protein
MSIIKDTDTAPQQPKHALKSQPRRSGTNTCCCVVVNAAKTNRPQTKCCGKTGKIKTKDISPECIKEMKELRTKLGVSYLGLAKLYGMTRFVIHSALTKDDKTC